MPQTNNNNNNNNYTPITQIENGISLNQLTTSTTTTTTKRDKPKIPDGGWGWMIVFSSLVLSLIQDGISFSFGILYIEFVQEFQASSSATSWIGSLFLSVPLLTGPIMSALVDKYGCRKMTILGGLISATGFILSSFARSIALMYLSFGIMSGLGLGLTYITCVVSIAFWFDKKRSLAVGLGACGTGIGTFVYAPFTTYLLFEYGWRGTVRLLAGTLLNICVCGALMRDPDWIIEQNRQEQLSKSDKASSLSLVSMKSEKINLDDIRDLLKSGKDAEFVLQTLATKIEIEDGIEGENKTRERYQSLLDLPTFIKQHEKVPYEVLEHLSQNKKLYQIIMESYPSLLLSRSVSDQNINKLIEDPNIISRIPVKLSVKMKKKPPTNSEDVNEALLDKKRQPTGNRTVVPPHVKYFKNIRLPRHSLIHHSAVLNKNKYRLRASSCPNIYRVSMSTINERDDSWWTVIVDSFKEMFDFSLLFEFHFCLMSLSTMLLFAWFMTPYFYLADHMNLIGYTKTEASFIISTIGVTNTIGMVVYGWAGDQSWANIPKILAVSLILCGICSSTMIFFSTNYVMLVLSAAVYGATLASSFSFTPPLIVELLPLDRFTTAYGLNLMFQGIGHLGGPPLAGALYDITRSWDASFHLAGVFIIIAGLLIVIIPYTKNRKLIGEGPVEKELEKE